MTFLRPDIGGRNGGISLKINGGQIFGQNDFPGKLALADLQHGGHLTGGIKVGEQKSVTSSLPRYSSTQLRGEVFLDFHIVGGGTFQN
jgi:hypothetical protein